MKILHVLTSPRAEGTPRLVLDWLTIKEHEQYVLFLNSNPPDLLPLFTTATTNINITDTYHPSYLKKCWAITSAVYKTSSKIRPQLVISWNQGYSHWIILGARLAGVQRNMVHGGCEPIYNNLRSKLYNYYVHWPLYIMGAKLVCASAFIQNKFKQIPLLPASNIFFAPNCFQPQRFIFPLQANQQREPIAIMVANLEPGKNHMALLRAWKLVLKEIPEAKLWLVGRGTMRTTLEDFCRNNGLENSVVFWGERRDVPQLLWKARIFVFSSLSEGFGTVLLEALAAGLRIVSSDIPACREVLQNGQFGTLVEVTNTQLFAEKITENLKIGNLSDIEWQKAIEYVNNFSPATMVKRYLDIAFDRS
ncbi:MAG: glycosyltransferase [Bacteroidales bacterium]